MSDAGVLQARLRQSKFDGANGARTRKLLQQILKITSLVEDGTQEEVDAAYQAFLNNLAVYEFNMGKIQVVADTSARDAQAYGEQQVQLKAEMERTEADIAKLKDQVAHERVVRKNKEEYAALASQVEALPPRTKTERDKEAQQQQIARLEEQNAAQQQKMELRKKQMTLLLHLAEELKRDMENDNEQMDAEEGKIAEAKPAAAQGGGDTEMGEAD